LKIKTLNIRNLFLIILSLLIYKGQSQNSNNYKNEISVGIISIFNNPKDNGNTIEDSYYWNYLNFIIYKRFFYKHSAIRLIYHRPINATKIFSNDGVLGNEYSEQKFGIGYEYRFQREIVSYHMAIDINYLTSRLSLSGIIGNGFFTFFNSEKNRKGIGLSPAIGIEIKLYRMFSIGVESNINIIFIKENEFFQVYTNYKGKISNGNSYIYKNEYKEFRPTPLNLYIKFKF